MKREEEIRKAVQKCEWISKSLNLQSAFIEGAKWADEHPNLSEEEQVGMGGLGMIWQKKTLRQ